MLYDITGRLIRTLERECSPGQNEFDLDASALPLGAYWYIAKVGAWQQSGKLIKF